MTQARLGLGIVGAGFIAESHARAAESHAGLRLAAVHDLDDVAARVLAARHDARTRASLDDVLADPDVDVVVLCTPNDTHHGLALRTAAAGKHLLLEKPLALSGAQAREIVTAFADRGLTLQVGHTHRHTDYARTIEAALRGGAVGRPRSIRLAITAGWIWGQWGSWVLDPERSGGHAFHNGVHLYDLVGWWMAAPVVRVHAIGQQLTSSALPIDDSLVATLELADGGAAITEISRGERPRSSNLFEAVVHGTTGTLVRRWSSDGTVVFGDATTGAVPSVGADPFRRQLAALHDAIRGGHPPVPGPEAAVHAVDVAEAVEASARSGDVVEVPGSRVPT